MQKVIFFYAISSKKFTYLKNVNNFLKHFKNKIFFFLIFLILYF